MVQVKMNREMIIFNQTINTYEVKNKIWYIEHIM